MLGGDISNKTVPTVLVRMEDTLIKDVSKPIFGLKLRQPKYVFEEHTLAMIIRLSMKTHYKVSLVCYPENYKHFKDLLDGVSIPFSELVYHGDQTITNFLNCGVYFCYIDEDSDRILKVNHKSCYSVAEFTNLVL